MPAQQTQSTSRPSVHIGATRRVVIGRGEHRVTFQTGPVSQWTGPGRRVTLEARPRQVVIGGRQGIAGPPGPGSEIEIYTAAETIGGHRGVALAADGRIVRASASGNLAAIGIIRDAVVAGAEVVVYRAGRVGGFTGLTIGETYFLGDDGLATLTLPVSGTYQTIGVAATASELLVDPGLPIRI